MERNPLPLEIGQQQSQTRRQMLKRVMWLAQNFILIASAIVMAAFSAYKDVKVPLHVLVAGGCCLIITYLSALLLVYFKMFLSDGNQLRGWHCPVLQLLCMISGAMLIATNSVFLVLVNEGQGLFAFNLLPLQSIIGMLAYYARPTADSMHDEAFVVEIKSSCKLSLFATTAAYAVQIPVVFGYLKNSTFKGPRQRVDLAVSFLASALSVFSVVATCMPLGFQTTVARDKMLSIVRHLKRAVVVSLAVTGVILGEEFLGGNVVLSLFPELMIAAIYCGKDLFGDESAEQQRRNGDQKVELLPTFIAATFGFAMLGTAYATFLGTGGYDFYMKALAFTLLTAVMSSLCRVVPLYDSRCDTSSATWMGFICNVLPVVEMLVACPLAAKVVIDLFAIS